MIANITHKEKTFKVDLTQPIDISLPLKDGNDNPNAWYVPDVKMEAVAERERQVTAAEAEINLSANQAREALRGKLAGLVVSGAEKLIDKEIDGNRHRDLIDQLIKEIYSTAKSTNPFYTIT